MAGPSGSALLRNHRVQLCLRPLLLCPLPRLQCQPNSTYIAVYRYYRILSENIAFAIIAILFETTQRRTANLRMVIDG
jgi:hypothetical protein